MKNSIICLLILVLAFALAPTEAKSLIPLYVGQSGKLQLHFARFLGTSSIITTFYLENFVVNVLSTVYFYGNFLIFYFFCSAMWQNYFYDMGSWDAIQLCLDAAENEVASATAVSA